MEITEDKYKIIERYVDKTRLNLESSPGSVQKLMECDGIEADLHKIKFVMRQGYN